MPLDMLLKFIAGQGAGKIPVEVSDDFKRLIAEAVVDSDLHSLIRRGFIESEKRPAVFHYGEDLTRAVLANTWTVIADVPITEVPMRELSICNVITVGAATTIGLFRISIYDWKAPSPALPRICQIGNTSTGPAVVLNSHRVPIPDNARGFRLEYFYNGARTVTTYYTARPFRLGEE
jgi:hypothetical protein